MPVTQEQPKKEQVNSMEIVELNYPQKNGWMRTVNKLWGNYFRVDYYDQDTEVFPETNFLQVKDGKVKRIGD